MITARERRAPTARSKQAIFIGRCYSLADTSRRQPLRPWNSLRARWLLDHVDGNSSTTLDVWSFGIALLERPYAFLTSGDAELRFATGIGRLKISAETAFRTPGLMKFMS